MGEIDKVGLRSLIDSYRKAKTLSDCWFEVERLLDENDRLILGLERIASGPTLTPPPGSLAESWITLSQRQAAEMQREARDTLSATGTATAE